MVRGLGGTRLRLWTYNLEKLRHRMARGLPVPRGTTCGVHIWAEYACSTTVLYCGAARESAESLAAALDGLLKAAKDGYYRAAVLQEYPGVRFDGGTKPTRYMFHATGEDLPPNVSLDAKVKDALGDLERRWHDYAGGNLFTLFVTDDPSNPSRTVPVVFAPAQWTMARNMLAGLVESVRLAIAGGDSI